MAGADRKRIEVYLGRLYGYAFSLCRDRTDAEDLVHDCIVKSLSCRTVPADEAAFRTWLFRILKNAFIDGLRKSNVRSSYLEDQRHMSGPDSWLIDESALNALAVRQEIIKLPQHHREIIGLIDMAGFSYEEVAELLDIPSGTVMSRISRARALLLDAMQAGRIQALPVKNCLTRKLGLK